MRRSKLSFRGDRITRRTHESSSCRRYQLALCCTRVRRVHGCVRLRSRIIFYKRGSNVAFKRERRVYPFYASESWAECPCPPYQAPNLTSRIPAGCRPTTARAPPLTQPFPLSPTQRGGRCLLFPEREKRVSPDHEREGVRACDMRDLAHALAHSARAYPRA